MVSSEDDLGPEMIFNLKWLDPYRYPTSSIFLYLDFLQQNEEIFGWSRILNNPTDEAMQKNEQCAFCTHLDDYETLKNANEREYFGQHIRKAPYFFNALNSAMIDCKYNEEREMRIYNYSKIFMSQPLPHGLLSLETNRILRNEKLLPGITKILLIAQDFPQLNISSTNFDFWNNHHLAVIGQMSQVFVYEEENYANGTLNLLKILPNA